MSGGKRDNAGRKSGPEGALVSRTYRLPVWQVDALQVTAAKHGISVSELLRNFISWSIRDARMGRDFGKEAPILPEPRRSH